MVQIVKEESGYLVIRRIEGEATEFGPRGVIRQIKWSFSVVRRSGSPAPDSLFLHPSQSLELESNERKTIRKALELTNWNKTEAAKLLGITRVTLYDRIRKYEFMRDEDGGEAITAKKRI